MGSSTCPVLTCKGGPRSGSGEREGRPPCGVLSALFNSSYFGRSPSGPSCVFGEIVLASVRRRAGQGALGHTPAARRRPRRLFLDRTHFSAEKTRGACARRRWGCSWLRLRRRGRRRVLLVGPASSPGARVRPTPQESVATLKFSTKKLVVARPRLKKVSFPLSTGLALFRGWLGREKLNNNNAAITFSVYFFERAALNRLLSCRSEDIVGLRKECK